MIANVDPNSNDHGSGQRSDESSEGPLGPHVDNNLPLDDDAERFVERCAGEYRRWLVSIAKVYAEQGNPLAASVTKRDVVAARSAILTWIGMAMGEFVVNGDDTYLHQFRAFNSIPYSPDDTD